MKTAHAGTPGSDIPRIVIHSNYHPDNHGGIEVVVRHLIKALSVRKQGLCCFIGDRKSYGPSWYNDFTTIVSRKILAKIAGAPLLSFGNLSFLGQAWRARLVIYQEPFPFLWPAMFVLNRLMRKPVIVLIHAHPASHPMVMKLYSMLRSVVFKGATCVTTSPHLMEKVGSPAFRSNLVVPLCVEESHPGPAAHTLGLPGRYALYIGRLAGYKGLEYLMDAARLSPEVHLVIAGDGPLSGYIKAAMAEAGLSNISLLNRFVTEQEKLELIARADYIIFPSTSQNEAFGLVQLEAMRASKAIVNTVLETGVNFVAPNRLCAITVEKMNSAALAEAMRLLWHDPALRKQLGANGRSRYLELFSESQFSETWTNLTMRCAQDDCAPSSVKP